MSRCVWLPHPLSYSVGINKFMLTHPYSVGINKFMLLIGCVSDTLIMATGSCIIVAILMENKTGL